MYEVLVATDPAGTADLSAVLDRLGDAVVAFRSYLPSEGIVHELLVDTSRVRNTVAHGYAFSAGFFPHLKLWDVSRVNQVRLAERGLLGLAAELWEIGTRFSVEGLGGNVVGLLVQSADGRSSAEFSAEDCAEGTVWVSWCRAGEDGIDEFLTSVHDAASIGAVTNYWGDE